MMLQIKYLHEKHFKAGAFVLTYSQNQKNYRNMKCAMHNDSFNKVYCFYFYIAFCSAD